PRPEETLSLDFATARARPLTPGTHRMRTTRRAPRQDRSLVPNEATRVSSHTPYLRRYLACDEIHRHRVVRWSHRNEKVSDAEIEETTERASELRRRAHREIAASGGSLDGHLGLDRGVARPRTFWINVEHGAKHD